MDCYHSCNNRCNILLTIRKTDSLTGAGIAGAGFELTGCSGFRCSGTTDADGLLVFGLVPCTRYMLRETSAPSGYIPVDHVYRICVDACGRIRVDGAHTARIHIRNMPVSASFTAIKVNIENGMPLAGAAYALYMNSSEIASAISDAAGRVTFTGLSPGTYELVETVPPPGFQTNAERLTVVVARDGSVTIMGQPASGFILNDIPIGEFSFLKLDASTGSPLGGATFALTQNGTGIGTAESDANGLVNFGVLDAGTYQLTETIAPAGFERNDAVYQVVVGANGSITVDGVPLDAFEVQDIPIAVSAPPAINTIVEGDLVITGTGIPGATILVTLPNGSTVSATVASGGTWSVNVPAGVMLVEGDVVSANQTEPDKIVSSVVNATVIGNPAIEPGIDVYAENLSTGLNYAQAGDMLLYDAIISNNGTPASVWPAAYVTFYLDSILTLQESSIRINNRAATPSQYSYDSAANTLTVYLGDIAGGRAVSVSFRVTVNESISDIHYVVMETVLGSLV